MKNPFNPQDLPIPELNRNAYDLHYDSLLTTDFGKLTPVFCQEVLPNHTVEIDTSIGVRGMPTVFPVQTPIRVSIEYYYCRNRCVHNEFEDFIFNTKSVEAPWLRMDRIRLKKMFKTGSLGDFLGSASTKGSSSFVADLPFYSSDNFCHSFNPRVNLNYTPSLSDLIAYLQHSPEISFSSTYTQGTFYGYLTSPQSLRLSYDSKLTFPSIGSLQSQSFVCGVGIVNTIGGHMFLSNTVIQQYFTAVSSSVYNSTDFPSAFIDSYNALLDRGFNPQILIFRNFYDSNGNLQVSSLFPTSTSSERDSTINWPLGTVSTLVDSVTDATDDVNILSHPYLGNDPVDKISAFPFRHYEMICNYYYRNDKNNPYYLNGQPQYNKFIPSYDSGPDDNVYDFHFRNWELDRYTSAQHTPQFGEAPLVGLTYNPDGRTATLTFEASGQSSDGVSISNPTATVGLTSNGNLTDIADFSSDLPAANLKKLMRQIDMGISIYDLRMTNSFQRFLENTMRRGLRYRNQLLSHFGAKVDYPDIDIPQYIGGFSGSIDPGQVTNMADSPNAGLGDYVGTLSGGVKGSRKISCFCPEHGFIIGILSISPVPFYSQNTKKYLLKTNPFDYFTPEFGKCGFGPITYSELCPMQTPAGKSPHDVFGYQKLWSDYMENLNEVHGDFRTTLKDFILTRTFEQRPVLSESFTVIHPDQLNDVFVSNNIADKYGSNAKFMVSCRFGCTGISQVPMFGTPSLE